MKITNTTAATAAVSTIATAAVEPESGGAHMSAPVVVVEGGAA